MHLFPTSKTVRRSTIAASVLALGVLAFSPAADASIAGKKPTIDTYTGWDQSSAVGSFGCPNTTTYGETITIPKKKHKVTKAVIYMNDGGASGSMVARGEIYGWNGSVATTLVAETKPVTIDLQDANYDPVTFKFSGAKVKPGQQYVLFASIDKDYEQCANYTVNWGAPDGSAYAGGIFVYQNNGGDESQWTATPWSQISQLDAALQIYMSK